MRCSCRTLPYAMGPDRVSIIPIDIILVLDSFLQSVRDNQIIWGLRVVGVAHKTAVYADNLLFVVTNSAITLPNLLQDLQTYATFSNDKEIRLA